MLRMERNKAVGRGGWEDEADMEKITAIEDTGRRIKRTKRKSRRLPYVSRDQCDARSVRPWPNAG